MHLDIGELVGAVRPGGRACAGARRSATAIDQALDIREVALELVDLGLELFLALGEGRRPGCGETSRHKAEHQSGSNDMICDQGDPHGMPSSKFLCSIARRGARKKKTALDRGHQGRERGSNTLSRQAKA